MKIISKFKDYYDYLGYSYGQDEKYVYKRELFTFEDYNKVSNKPIIKSNRLPPLYTNVPWYKRKSYPEYEKQDIHYTHAWLIICGRLFLIYWTSPRDIIGFVKGDPIEKVLPTVGDEHKWMTTGNIQRYIQYYMAEDFMGAYQDQYLKINIEHKSPICVICPGTSSQVLCITTKSPILGDITNFVSMYPADQLYQDIYYFLANQINPSADTNPPVELDDKYKIQYHGFDKVSFRPKLRDK